MSGLEPIKEELKILCRFHEVPEPGWIEKLDKENADTEVSERES